MPASMRALSARLRRGARRAAARRQESSRSSCAATDGFIEAVTLEGGSASRPTSSSMLGLSRPADRAGAEDGLRGLVALAALRSRGGRAVRERRRAHAVHALDRARGRLAMAHSAAAPHRQRLRVLQPVHQRRRSARDAARAISTAARSPSRSSCKFTTGAPQEVLESRTASPSVWQAASWSRSNPPASS